MSKVSAIKCNRFYCRFFVTNIKKYNTKCNIKNIKIKNMKYNIKLNMSIMKKTQDTAKSLYPVFLIVH